MRHEMGRSLEGRIVVYAALLCFATLGLSAQTQQPQWKTYSYGGDGFSASFPSEPGLQKKNVDTKAGPFELRSYVVMEDTAALFVGVCDYGDNGADTDADTRLQGAKNGALESSKSHLVSEEKITLGIYRGLKFESESDNAHFSARIYMVGTTLYQTLVVAPLGSKYADETRFLDSFQLIPRERN